jgi:5-methylcytosine-specific restriction endonuclease McrA
MTEEEHLIVYGKVLDVHHIDYDRKNSSEDNLITLCRQCNIRANFNRGYWEEFFLS